MKRTLTPFALFLLCALPFVAGAVGNHDTAVQPSVSDQCVYISKIQPASLRSGAPALPGLSAVFDLQGTYNLDSIASGSSSFAACAWTGTEWWVSQWNKDSLYTLAPNGVLTSSFRIAGIGNSTSGVRGMTTDGTYLYLADNTTTIKRVDPATKTLVSTITASSVPFNIRAITYDPTASGGAGGFWVSNFNTAIAQIDMAGNFINSIPATTHTLTGIYGIALDTLTAGGPYLWAFDQTSAGTAANLVRLQLPGGTPTFVSRNVNLDIGPATGGNTGIAGGLFITPNFASAQYTIAGVVQGTPDDILFAMELNDVTQAAYDASLDTFQWQPGYTIVPDEQLLPVIFPAVSVNRGGNIINTLNLNVNAYQGVTSLYSGSGTATAVAPGSSTIIAPSNSWTPPGRGSYRIAGQVSIAGQTDQNPVNDTLSFRLTVSDTVFARDNSVVNGALGIGDSTGGTLGQIYTFTQADFITSATFRTNRPTAGDSTRIVVYDYNNSAPDNMIGASDYYVFTTADTSGAVKTFEVKDLSGNPLAVSPATYFIGVEEHVSNISLATSNFNWRPDVGYVTFTNQPWAPVESFGFRRTFVLRVNTGYSLTGVSEPVVASGHLILYPNPGQEYIRFRAEEPLVRLEILDMAGRMVGSQALPSGLSEQVADIHDLTTGVYRCRTLGRSGRWYEGRLVRP
jgi:hypothetical protein